MFSASIFEHCSPHPKIHDRALPTPGRELTRLLNFFHDVSTILPSPGPTFQGSRRLTQILRPERRRMSHFSRIFLNRLSHRAHLPFPRPGPNQPHFQTQDPLAPAPAHSSDAWERHLSAIPTDDHVQCRSETGRWAPPPPIGTEEETKINLQRPFASQISYLMHRVKVSANVAFHPYLLDRLYGCSYLRRFLT